MISEKLFRKYASNPEAFRNDLIVDVDGIARKFGDVQDDWQRDDFSSLDPALKRCSGRSEKPAKMRAYLERGRGHSKTTDIAVTCVWALTFATRPIRGYAYAADKDQAKLLLSAIETIARLNPWLYEILDFYSHSVSNGAEGHPGEGAELTIEASDVGSSFGILPDLIVADELTHWEGDGSLFHSLISSAAKRTNCLLLVISNAGFADSWQYGIREAARTDDDWYFSRLDGPQASWLNDKRLDEQRRMLPTVAFARLWGNQWSTGGGDALTEADINYAFKDELREMAYAEPGMEYVAGLDLGIVRDASAVVVLGIKRRHDGHGTVQLAHTRIWRPTKDKRVDLQEVEDALIEIHFRFQLKSLAYDPWAAQHMAQRLTAGGLAVPDGQRYGSGTKVPMVEIPQTGSTLQKMASTLIQAFVDRRVNLYHESSLRRDLLKLRIEERTSFYRLISPRDEHGHGDMASAFCLAMLVASDLAGTPICSAGAIDLDNPHSGKTSLDRAWANHQREAEEYAREQAEIDDPAQEAIEKQIALMGALSHTGAKSARMDLTGRITLGN